MKTSAAVTTLIIFMALGGVVWSSRLHVKPRSTNTAVIENENRAAATANTNVAPLASTSALDEYQAAHLTVVESAAMFADLQNSSKYTMTTQYSLVGDCGSSANVDILRTLNTLRTVQIVNGVYPIVRTPNSQGWNMAAANQFMSDPTIVCGVGFFYPFEVTPDHILWRQACSSGMLPTDTNSHLLPDITQCLQAQEAISLHYGLTD